MPALQSFCLNTQNIMSDPAVQTELSNMNKNLRDSLFEINIEVFKKLEALYNENPDLKKDDQRVEALQNEIKSLLANIFPDKQELLNKSTEGYSHNSAAHLAFVYQKIEEGKSLGEIVTELTTRYTGQFQEDFIKRDKIKLMDQNGNILSENFLEEIRNKAGKDNKTLDPSSIRAAIKEKWQLTFSDEQFSFIIARMNQRSITGSSMSFVDPEKEIMITTNPTHIFHVHVNQNNEKTLQLIESQSSLQIPNTDTGEMTEVTKISTLVNVSNLTGNNTENQKFLPLPCREASEVILYEALDPRMEVDLPQSLHNRTGIDKLSEEMQARLLMNAPSEELKNQALQQLLVSAVISGRSEQKEGQTLVEHVQNKIASVFSEEQQSEIKDNPELKTGIEKFIKEQNPGLLTKIVQSIKFTINKITGIGLSEEEHKMKTALKAAKKATLETNLFQVITKEQPNKSHASKLTRRRSSSASELGK